MTVSRTETYTQPVFSPINQSAFQNLLIQTTRNVKFADLLISAGYSTEIKNIDINLDANQKIDFSGCHFENTTFSGHFQLSSFNNVQFQSSTFHEADFSRSTFNNAHFTNCAFVEANFKDAAFYSTQISISKVWNSDFSNTVFVRSSIDHSLFAKANLENVINYQNTIEDMHIVFNQPYQSESSFSQANFHQIKPTVALVGDTEWHSTPYYIVNEYSGVSTTISQYAPESIDTRALAIEVKNALVDINLHGLQAPSIAQHVINSQSPMIKAIKDFAYAEVVKVDAIWIPGGPDLHPEFYGEQNTYSTPSSDYYREILEFSLADAAIAMDKPIIGVCHGSQLVNVYLGGTLHQHVDGQNGITPLLEVVTRDGLLGSVISEGPVHGPSYHHQAVKDVAPNLEVVAKYNGVIKATQATDGSKIMLTQYHPENEYDQNSSNVLNKFIDLSAESKIKSKAIELSDVIDFGTPLDHVLNSLDNHSTIPPTLSVPVVDNSGWVGNFGAYLMETIMPSVTLVA